MDIFSEVKWCRDHFNRIRLNGIWAVPRSGLVFKKTSDKHLELIEFMPWTEEMAKAVKQGRDVPATEQDLWEYQRGDFDAIARRFKLAGITVLGREKIGGEK